MEIVQLNASLPVYDKNGNQINTDIMVSGYIRETIDIPSEIVRLCFLFWFIDICDTWDASKSNPNAIINGACVKCSSGDHWTLTVYGTHCIDSGSYEWRIKCKTHVFVLSIGLIEDRDDLLKRHQNDNYWALDGKGCALINNGGFFYSRDSNDDIAGCCKAFGKKGTIIIMRLDIDKQSVRYKIDDKDYGYIDAKCVKKDERYRLAVGISSEKDSDGEIE